MRLEALEFVVRRQMRILVVEVHDEADRDQIVAEVIDERAAAGARVERPALAVHARGPGDAVRGATCHSSLMPMPYFCGSTPSRRLKRCHQLPATASRGSLRRTACTCACSSMPGWYSGLCVPSFATPMSPVATPRTAPSSSYSTSAAAKPGIDLDAERLRLLRRASGRRCRGSRCSCRDCSSAAAAAACGMRYALSRVRIRKRSSVTGVSSGAPCAFQSGISSFERARIDDGAGQDVRADLRALLEHAHGRSRATCSRGELLQADRRGEPGGTAADDHHVVLHRFARHRRHLAEPMRAGRAVTRQL